MKIGNYSSKLFGSISIATKDEFLTHVSFGHQVMVTVEKPNQSIVDQVLSAIDDGVVAPNIPIKLEGTEFQLKVWNALRNIPPGVTLTYQLLAHAIGHPKAYRAVGTACGNNPIAVIIPCHRIISSSGKLGGYRWGEDIKIKLLDREKDSNKVI